MESALRSLATDAPIPARRRTNRPSRTLRTWLVRGGAFTAAAVVVGAPLVAGAVHRGSMAAVFVLVGLAVGALLIGEAVIASKLRLTGAALAFSALMVVPVLQSVPLPARIAARIDPAGQELLAGRPGASAAFRPVTLDPVATRIHIGRAAAALGVLVIAMHLAAGQSYRQLLIKGVVLGGIAAVIIGLGHRILGETKIYGVFTASTGPLNGPFVNRNHTAQFLELAAFTAVALAASARAALQRVGWLAAAVFLLAGVLATLSRGAVLALAVGGVVFVAFANVGQDRRLEAEGAPKRRRSVLFWAGLVAALVAIVGASVGATQLLARFSESTLADEARFRLWANSLAVLKAHPFGIGRGAFERVFPVYQDIEGKSPVRFDFVENEPLQLLIEAGWVGFALLVAAAGYLIWFWRRNSRRDLVELALAAGVISVATHNFVDFGFEAMGVLLPFAAVLGTMLGRMSHARGAASVPRKITWVTGGAVAMGALVGLASVAHASAADFDVLVRRAPTAAERRALAITAQAAHPTDYFYVLAQATVEPLRPGADGRSPRLKLLNRALLLCPNCPEVHTEVGRTLWSLGRRSQALGEWKLAVARRPSLLQATVDELFRTGARPEELAQVAANDPAKLVAIANYLMERAARPGAREVLQIAANAGAPRLELLLLQAGLELAEGKLDVARERLAEAHKLAPTDARVFLLEADAVTRAGDPEKALAVLDQGVGMNPYDLGLQRKRIELILGTRRLHSADRALEGLALALQRAQVESTGEVNLASARIEAQAGNWRKAVAQYRIVLSLRGNDAGIWAEVGAFYESIGQHAQALEAFQRAHQLNPGNAPHLEDVRRIEARRAADKARVSAESYMGTP